MAKEIFKHEVQFSGYGEFAIYNFDHRLSKGEIVFEPNFVGSRPAYFKVTRVEKADGRDVMQCKFRRITKLWVALTKAKVTKV